MAQQAEPPKRPTTPPRRGSNYPKHRRPSACRSLRRQTVAVQPLLARSFRAIDGGFRASIASAEASSYR